MQSYEAMVRNCYAPLIRDNRFTFAVLDGDEFFLIGNGFALYVFIDRRDKRSDIWYVSLEDEGTIKVRTLMYIQKNRYTQEDFSLYGNPTNSDEKIVSEMKVDVSGLMSRCHDILSGDKNWLKDYPDKGDNSRHIARFLAPYFRQQGHYVKPIEE